VGKEEKGHCSFPDARKPVWALQPTVWQMVEVVGVFGPRRNRTCAPWFPDVSQPFAVPDPYKHALQSYLSHIPGAAALWFSSDFLTKLKRQVDKMLSSGLHYTEFGLASRRQQFRRHSTINQLQQQFFICYPKTSTAAPEPDASTTSTTTSSTRQALSRNDVNKRIEQDREQHKRLRERRRVQPALHNPVSFQPPQPACFYPLTEPGGRQEELASDIEFENEWDATGDWNEDGEEAVKEAADPGFPIDDGK